MSNNESDALMKSEKIGFSIYLSNPFKALVHYEKVSLLWISMMYVLNIISFGSMSLQTQSHLMNTPYSEYQIFFNDLLLISIPVLTGMMLFTFMEYMVLNRPENSYSRFEQVRKFGITSVYPLLWTLIVNIYYLQGRKISFIEKYSLQIIYGGLFTSILISTLLLGVNYYMVQKNKVTASYGYIYFQFIIVMVVVVIYAFFSDERASDFIITHTEQIRLLIQL